MKLDTVAGGSQRKVNLNRLAMAAGWATALAMMPTLASAESIPLQVAGFFSSNPKIVDTERPFFEGLAERTGLDIAVTYAPQDQLGVQMPDALRLVGGKTFDIMVAGFGNVARDDPFLAGIDIAGAANSPEMLRQAVDAYYPALEERLKSKFNVRPLAIYPGGINGIFCVPVITSVADLAGKKVRTYNASQAKMIETLGATAVTMQMPEVYSSLERGVIDCATTSPSAANVSKWTEVTKSFVPINMSGALGAYYINLDTWAKFTPEQQAVITAEFKTLEDQLWVLATTLIADATNCNTGLQPCTMHQPYALTQMSVSPEDAARVSAAATAAVTEWAATCDSVYAECSTVWSGTIGTALGIALN